MKTVGGSTEGLVNCLSPKEEDVDSEWVTVEIPRETEQGLCVCVCVCVCSSVHVRACTCYVFSQSAQMVVMVVQQLQTTSNWSTCRKSTKSKSNLICSNNDPLQFGSID